MAQRNSDTTIKSNERLFTIIEALKQSERRGITEIATELDMSKSTVYRHVNSLEKNQFVVKEEGQYRLGLRFLDLGMHAIEIHPQYSKIKEVVQQLAKDTNEIAYFLVEEHGSSVWVFKESGDNTFSIESRVGTRCPLHTTAAGKAILGHIPETKRNVIISQVATHTESTQQSSEKALFEELATVRERGFAQNKDENDWLRAVAVPVFDRDGDLIGGLGVAGPTVRMQGTRFSTELPNLLLSKVNNLELSIAYD